MNLAAFTTWRDETRKSRPELVDRSELNVYRALAPTFPMIPPSEHPEAPYRCHLAEVYLGYLGLTGRERALVSHGVRRSLSAVFAALSARRARVSVPTDVYPVYLDLAARAGVTVVPYRARDGLPDRPDTDAILICEPLKPWGGGLDAAATRTLAAWAREDERRMVIVDGAYAPWLTDATRELIDDEAAVVLASLSKGWLLPDHAGLCVCPERFTGELRPHFAQLSKDEQRLRVGYAALTAHADRPTLVAGVLHALRHQLDAWGTSRPTLKLSPCDGYFAVSPLHVHALVDEGVLAVPASVFGGPADVSVLSSLPAVPHTRGRLEPHASDRGRE